MDIYEYLKADHKKVSHLFKLFKDAPSEERKKQIVSLLVDDLLLHATSEKQTFYKKLEEFEDSKEPALHGEKEHKDIENQIQIVMSAKNFDTDWENSVLKLKEIVDHHVSEEEGKVFRSAKKVLSEKEAYILKEKMHYLKGQLKMDGV